MFRREKVHLAAKCICHSSNSMHCLHIVDANHVCSVGDRPSDGSSGSFYSIIRREIKNFSNKRFSRCADKDRLVQVPKLAEPAQNLQIVVNGFAKSNAGVNNNLTGRNACRFRLLNTALKPRRDF